MDTTDEVTVMNSYFSLLSNLPDITDRQSALRVSTTISRMYESYSIELNLNQVCFNDLQCFAHGKCVTSGAFSYCSCSYGFGGSNCQFPEPLLAILYDKVENILTWLQAYVNSLTLDEYVDELQMITQILTQLGTDAKLLASSEFIEKALSIIEPFRSLTTDQAVKIPSDLRDHFIKSIASIFVSYYNRLNVEDLTPDYILYPDKLPSEREALIAARDQERLITIETLLNTTLGVLDILVGTALPNDNPIVVETKMFRASLESNLVSHYQDNNISTSPFLNGVHLQIPASVFQTKVNVPSNNAEIRLRLVQFYQNPYRAYTEAFKTETDVIFVDFFDSFGQPIPLKDLADPIDIYIPWSFDHHKTINPELISCAWWDKDYIGYDNITWIVKENVSVINIDLLEPLFGYIPNTYVEMDVLKWELVPALKPNFNTSGCSAVAYDDNHYLCRCNHLTAFAGIQAPQSNAPWQKRISNFFGIDIILEWQKTLGFYTLLAMTSLYAILVVTCWLGEQRALRRKLRDLFKARVRIERSLFGKDLDSKRKEIAKPGNRRKVYPGDPKRDGLLEEISEKGKQNSKIDPGIKKGEKPRDSIVSLKDITQGELLPEGFIPRSKVMSRRAKKRAEKLELNTDEKKQKEAAEAVLDTQENKSILGGGDTDKNESLRILPPPQKFQLGGGQEAIEDKLGYLFARMANSNKGNIPPLKENLERPSNTRVLKPVNSKEALENSSKNNQDKPDNREDTAPNLDVTDLNVSQERLLGVEDEKPKTPPAKTKSRQGSRAVSRRASNLSQLSSKSNKIKNYKNSTIREEDEGTSSINRALRDDMSMAQEIMLHNEDPKRGKISLKKLGKNAKKYKEEDPLALKASEYKNDLEISRLIALNQETNIPFGKTNDYSTLMKLKSAATKHMIDEYMNLSFWQLYVRSAPFVNIAMITSFLHPRYTRLTLIFINAYLHTLFAAVFYLVIHEDPILLTDVSISRIPSNIVESCLP